MTRMLVLCFALFVTPEAFVSRAAEAAGAATPVNLAGAPDGSAKVWLESSLRRVFPKTQPGSSELRLLAARNMRLSFQVAARNEHTKLLFVECAIAGTDDLKPRVRAVGLVPVRHVTPLTEASEIDGLEHIPGLVPDPLLPETSLKVGPFESRSFWITLNVPADAKPGPREFTVRVTARSGTATAKETVVELPVRLQVGELVVQPRKDFPVTHWWQGQATWDHYKTGMFEDPKWWEITRAQLENMLDHGSDVIYVPMFFLRRETFVRPCQLLVVNEPSPGKYAFDWTQTKKFVDMCRDIGFTKFEWPHMWIYWGVKNPMPIYTEREKGKYELLWPKDISGFSDTYLNFLRQFLPEFKAFLDREGLLEHSYFHLSDEPHKSHIENYRKARAILRDLAPWMKTMDALSDIAYGREGVTDMPIPQVDDAQKFIDEKIPHWVYYCTSPKGPWINRFMDTPLVKVRMSGWLFYRLGARGFLHWGYNYWHKIETEQLVDPFTDGSAADYPGIPYGDPFVIYPGPDGKPIDSLRWEVFAESLQDYAMLQSAGIKPDDPLLAELKTYAEFPRDPEWFRGAMERLIARKSVAATTR
jgi:hypothetical protein